jgi:molybdopterin converting factor subunit 1
MSIRILFFASLADATGMSETELEAVDYPDVASIYARFAKDFPKLKAYRKSILYAINQEFARPDSPVSDGDEVAFLPPVSGG